MTLRNDIQIAIIKSYEVGSDTTTEQIISIFQERFDEIRSVLPKHPRSEITSTHRSIFDEIERLSTSNQNLNLKSKTNGICYFKVSARLAVKCRLEYKNFRAAWMTLLIQL